MLQHLQNRRPELRFRVFRLLRTKQKSKITNFSIVSYHTILISSISLTLALYNTKRKSRIRINSLLTLWLSKKIYRTVKLQPTNQNPQTKGGRASYLHKNCCVICKTDVCCLPSAPDSPFEGFG